MTMILKIAKRLGRAPIVLLLLLGLALPMRAQNAESGRTTISDFVHSIAGAVYNLAWPTATYRSVSLDNIEREQGGYDVTVKLDGLSGIDGSDLWVRLVLVIRNGGLADIRVKNHNAFWRAPFETVGDFAAAIQAMNNGAAASSRPSRSEPGSNGQPVQETRTSAACLANPTQQTLIFSYRFGVSDWKQVTVEPNHVITMWADPGEGSKLEIKFDGDFAPGYQEQDYDLVTTSTTVPVQSCNRVANYSFVLDGSKIQVVVAQR